MLSRSKTYLKRYHQEQQGAAMILFALGFMMLVAAAGAAVDMSRAQGVRAKLSESLDAAGLAAGRKVSTADLNALVKNYLYVNFPDGYQSAHITSYSVTPNADNTVIKLSATATVDMTFMRILGKQTITVSADSEITRQSSGLELVMVLDTTGSMYSNDKIDDLKTAAGDMVDILFGDKETVENLWVGIVPYVTTVNIGADKAAWLSNYSTAGYTSAWPAGVTKWKGCVEERNQYVAGVPSNGMDVSDAIPVVGNPSTLFPMYFWDSNTDNAWKIISINLLGISITTLSLNENTGYGNLTAKGPNVGCGNQVTPLVSSKAQLKGAVSALTAWNRTGTMSSVGMGWGWRMISPKWRGMWGNAKLPLDYNTPFMNKAVVIMTDGVNEVYTPYSTTPPLVNGSDYTAYNRIGLKKLGSTVDTKSEGVTAINQRFATICQSMKDAGIIIYSITFQLGNSTTDENARSLFRNCATKPDYYFDSPDGATLKNSFKQIGDSLANLVISR